MMGATLLGVGAPAPRFSAPASDGTTYSLDGLLSEGSVILLFYPGNNTPG
jgi:peroxiredoxin